MSPNLLHLHEKAQAEDGVDCLSGICHEAPTKNDDDGDDDGRSLHYVNKGWLVGAGSWSLIPAMAPSAKPITYGGVLVGLSWVVAWVSYNRVSIRIYEMV